MPRINRDSQKLPWITPKKAEWKRIASDNQEIYNSPRWRKLRLMILNDSPLCIHCEKDRLITPATVCDHIIPINEGGLVWNESNIQTLCSTCHNKKSAYESHRTRRDGRQGSILD
jgi:5-methylcytosine-specific restriction endonuclease McrA